MQAEEGVKMIVAIELISKIYQGTRAVAESINLAYRSDNNNDLTVGRAEPQNGEIHRKASRHRQWAAARVARHHFREPYRAEPGKGKHGNYHRKHQRTEIVPVATT